MAEAVRISYPYIWPIIILCLFLGCKERENTKLSNQYFSISWSSSDVDSWEYSPINARDNLLKKYPRLNFTGAHLASLKWNVDELAKRFDRYPKMKADFSARIGHLQYQSLSDRKRVRNFLIKYQDRLLYGSDMTIVKSDSVYNRVIAGLRSRWMDHWIFLATDSSLTVKDLGNKKVKGLHLPREVIDKLFCKNAEMTFGFIEQKKLKENR